MPRNADKFCVHLSLFGWYLCMPVLVLTVCQAGAFGLNCAGTCSCNNGATCNRVTGVCTCAPGYRDVDCSLREYHYVHNHH